MKDVNNTLRKWKNLYGVEVYGFAAWKPEGYKSQATVYVVDSINSSFENFY